MKRVIIISALALAACTPRPLCDREQPYHKMSFVQDVRERPSFVRPERDRDEPDHKPRDREQPDREEPGPHDHSEPGDNGGVEHEHDDERYH